MPRTLKISAARNPALLVAIFSLSMSGAASGQQLGDLPVDVDAAPGYVRAISLVAERSDDEVRSFLASASFQNLSPEEADDLYLLVKARPGVAVPVLAEVLRTGLTSGLLARGEAAQVIDLLSYAADEQSLALLSDLLAEFNVQSLDNAVGRLLDYADGRVNPFVLAYRGMAMGNTKVQRQVVSWVESRAGQEHGLAGWASAILVNRAGTVALDELLTVDPIIAHMKDRKVPPGLLAELERQVAGKRPEPH